MAFLLLVMVVVVLSPLPMRSEYRWFWLAFRHSGGGSGDDNDKGGDGEGERVHERFSTWPQVVATTTTMKCRSALHKSSRHCRLGASVEVRSTDDCAQHQIG